MFGEVESEHTICSDTVGWNRLKGTAYDSVVGKSGKNRARNMNMDIRVPNFDLHVGKGQLLLDNAELNISYGVRYGIIGRNGIGKSVLLRAISGREVNLFFFTF